MGNVRDKPTEFEEILHKVFYYKTINKKTRDICKKNHNNFNKMDDF